MDDFDETKCILNPDDFKDDEKRPCHEGWNMVYKFCTQKSTGRKCVNKFLHSLDFIKKVIIITLSKKK